MEALFFTGKRTALRPKRTSVGEKVGKLNFRVHVKLEDSVPVPSRRASQTRHWDSVEIWSFRGRHRCGPRVASEKKKADASESGERSRLSLSVLQI